MLRLLHTFSDATSLTPRLLVLSLRQRLVRRCFTAIVPLQPGEILWAAFCGDQLVQLPTGH